MDSDRVPAQEAVSESSGVAPSWSSGQVRRLLVAGFLVVFATSASLAGTVVAYSEFRDRTGLSQFWLGFGSLLISVGVSAGYALSGPFADQHRFRSLLIVSCGLASTGAGCLSLSSAPLALVGLALLGLGAGVVGPVGFTAISLLRRRSSEGALVGLVSALDETGAMGGPLLTALLIGWLGVTGSYVTLAVVLAGFGVLVALVAPGVPTVASVSPVRRRRREVFAFPGFVRVFLLMVAVSVPFMSFRTLWDRYAEDVGGDNWLVGMSYLVGGVSYAVCSPLGGAWFARHPARRVGPLVVGVVGLYACYALVGAPLQMLALDAAFSVVTAFLYPGLLLAGAGALPESLRGTGNGVLVGGAVLCALPVGPLSGWLYEAVGRSTTFVVLAGLSLLLTLPSLLVSAAPAESP